MFTLSKHCTKYLVNFFQKFQSFYGYRMRISISIHPKQKARKGIFLRIAVSGSHRWSGFKDMVKNGTKVGDTTNCHEKLKNL